MKPIIILIAVISLLVANWATMAVPVVSSIDFTTFLIFISIVVFLIYRDRKNVKIEGIIFIRRTQKGKNFIDNIAGVSRGFWRKWGNIGAVVGVAGFVYGSYYLISHSLAILEGGAYQGVALLLPGPVAAPQTLPGVFVVPWWIWIIGISIVLFPHEISHGIMCRVDKVRIKSVGWMLLAVIPGAFVEQDDKQLKKTNSMTKMRVYAAGSFANIATGMIVFLILAAIFSLSFVKSGVFVAPINDTPAFAANLTGNIVSIDGKPVRSQSDLSRILSEYSAGDTVSVEAIGSVAYSTSFSIGEFLSPKPIAIVNESDSKLYTVRLDSHPQRRGGYLGVAIIGESYKYSGNDFNAYQTIVSLLVWIFIFSIGIGIVNLLPIKPLDGGLIFEEIASKLTKKPSPVVKAVGAAMLMILLFNLVGPMIL